MADIVKKRLLITGASRGIGAAMAKMSAKRGAKPILHASSDSPDAQAVARACLDSDEEFLFEDLSQPKAGKRLFKRAIEMAGQIDGVINNAGVYLPSPLQAGSEDEWDSGWATTMAVNTQAPADICRAAINHFQKTSRPGNIVNIASRAGHRGDGLDHAAYAASKGAILAMTKTWARALSGQKIHLFSIAPGWVETRMAPEDIENRKKAVAEIPLGRVAAPEEIAELALFLISGSCPSAVGATFDINGASYVR